MSGGPTDAAGPEDTGTPAQAPDGVPEDEVDEASEESFPASDAPQGWAGPADG